MKWKLSGFYPQVIHFKILSDNSMERTIKTMKSLNDGRLSRAGLLTLDLPSNRSAHFWTPTCAVQVVFKPSRTVRHAKYRTRLHPTVLRDCCGQPPVKLLLPRTWTWLELTQKPVQESVVASKHSSPLQLLISLIPAGSVARMSLAVTDKLPSASPAR